MERVEVVRFDPGLAESFATLNKEWILRYFRMEERDHYVLNHPEEAIKRPGGEIYFARYGGQVVGTCALIKVDPHTFELAKMAVTSACQGMGFGSRLLETAIADARSFGARQLVLYTNSRLHDAVRMYKRFGFVEVPKNDFHSERSDLKMQLRLG